MATLTPEKTHPVVGKDELIHQIAARSGLTLKDTSKVIDAFTEVVRDEIAQNHEVRLMGLGTWNLRTVAERRVKSIRGGKQSNSYENVVHVSRMYQNGLKKR